MITPATPMRLKRLLSDHGLRQTALARAVGVSDAAIAQIINHGLWPKRRDANALRDAILSFLADRGITDTASAFEAQATVTDHSQEDSMLRKQLLTPGAKKHFGLFRDPFTDDLQSHEDVYLSRDVRYVREAMAQTARHGGFMAVIGESGAGKSTLRRDLIDRIGRESWPVIVIEPYVLGMEDNDKRGKTLKAAHIAEAILAAVAPLERPRQSPEARFRQIHRVLKDSARSGNAHVLVIEEAHGLSTPTIKHLKRFFELEDGFRKLLSVVLIGQPELRLKLSETNHEVREVVQRCEVVELAPLDDGLEEYLTFRLGRIGKALPDVADTGAIAALRDRLSAAVGRGGRMSLLYPLAVGNLLTAAMNLAAALGVPQVTADVIREV